MGGKKENMVWNYFIKKVLLCFKKISPGDHNLQFNKKGRKEFRRVKTAQAYKVNRIRLNKNFKINFAV